MRSHDTEELKFIEFENRIFFAAKPLSIWKIIIRVHIQNGLYFEHFKKKKREIEDVVKAKVYKIIAFMGAFMLKFGVH